ncbi:hypothetical protein ACLQ2R_17615 [Streptosporangium sp. DT93]|uniref:hypothetical protein n=1 Tax=Streptosporangium sp. DT93 TaxID=3393428 RepID=UPI003CFB8CE6
MSRHTLFPNSTHPNDTLTIGWDAPLATFYARRTQPAPHPTDEPVEVFWIGGTPCELPTIQHLADALFNEGETLHADVAHLLDADRLAEGSRFLGRPATGLVAAVALETTGPEQADRIRAELTREAGRG